MTGNTDSHKKHDDKEKSKSHDHDDRNNADVIQEGAQFSVNEQDSDELIWIKDSCNVKVQTTDTQAAVSLQVGLQLAIALVVSITIGDTDRGQFVAQEIFQEFNSEQGNRQKIIIKNSKDVEVTTTDTDLAVNIQALLQVLVALVVKLDVL
jgi:spore coat protein X